MTANPRVELDENLRRVPREYQEFFHLCERIAVLAVEMQRDITKTAELADLMQRAKLTGPAIGVTSQLYRMVVSDLIELAKAERGIATGSDSKSI